MSLVDRRAKISVDALDAAVLISFALQYGATLEHMGAAMTRGEDGTPHGFMGALIDAALEAVGDDNPAPSGAALARPTPEAMAS